MTTFIEFRLIQINCSRCGGQIAENVRVTPESDVPPVVWTVCLSCQSREREKRQTKPNQGVKV